MDKKNKMMIFLFSIIIFSSFGLSAKEALDTKLGGVLETWKDWGLFDIVFPLILIYLIVFLAFYKAKIFSSITGEERKFSAITAFVVSAIALVPHIAYPASRYDVIYIINNALPKITLSLTMIIFILVMYGILFGPMGDDEKPFKKKTMAWISIILVSFIFIDSAVGEEGWMLGGIFAYIKNFFGSEDLLAFTFFVILGVIMWFITKPVEKSAEKKKDKEFKLVEK
ncbi:MAG: hypothetical protein PHT94_03390 [Candidatus Nanoarchaeia archaeon]|nr:hypothetical protein [Candidatus Nanoarchaeia archaeon]